MLTIRCSSLPRISLCPASARPPAVKIETSSEAADLGTAFHTCISQKIKGLPCDIAEVSAENGVDRDELKMLVGLGLAMWARLEKNFPDPVAEHSFEPLIWGRWGGGEVAPDVRLTGTGDLLSLNGNGSTINLLDWKSGWGDNDHEQQVRGYALLALREIPTADRVVASVMRVRRGILDTYEWARDELESWWEKLLKRVDSEAVYRPSPAACGHCPLFAECPARAAAVNDAIALFDRDKTNAGLAAPDVMAFILERARWVVKIAEAAEKAIKAAVINAGGSIPLPDGRELKITSQIRTEVDFPAGEGVLRQHCGDELGKALSVRKGKSKTDPDKLGIEDIVRAKAQRGQKDAAVEQLMYELDQAAALKLTTIQRLELVKAPKAIAKGEGQ